MSEAKKYTRTSGNLNELTKTIIGCAMKVHSALGPGLLESAYRVCLTHELRKAGLRVETEVPLPVVYDGVTLDTGYRLDIVVEDIVILELKCVERLTEVHAAQLLSYLRLSGRPLGLLVNFHVRQLRNGIRRLINGEIGSQIEEN